MRQSIAVCVAEIGSFHLGWAIETLSAQASILNKRMLVLRHSPLLSTALQRSSDDAIGCVGGIHKSLSHATPACVHTVGRCLEGITWDRSGRMVIPAWPPMTVTLTSAGEIPYGRKIFWVGPDVMRWTGNKRQEPSNPRKMYACAEKGGEQE